MRTFLILFIVLHVTLYGCSGKAEKTTNNIPAPLQDNKKEYSLDISKRSNDDLVESLYEDLKKQTPALRELEKNIGSVQQQMRDSLEPFEGFAQKNNSFYAAAGRHLALIQDSSLRSYIRTSIQKSLVIYNNRIQLNEQLVTTLENKNIQLNDLYTVLKITKTLQLMDKYQRSNLPSVNSLQQVALQYDKVIRQTNKMTNE